MSTTLDAICDGLAANLASIPGYVVYPTIPGAIATPCAVVGEPEINYDQSFGRGVDVYELPVLVLVSRADEDSGRAALHDAMDPSGVTSVKAAVQTDRSLGGSASDCRVTRVRKAGAHVANEIAYLGAEWTVEVWASGA